MTALTWTDTLALQHPQMDATHQEFVSLLGATDAALGGPEPVLLARFQALVDHTVDHFAQEERWMEATGFAPGNCHAGQHQEALAVMQGCAERAADPEEADFEPLRMAVSELAVWFPQHAQMMDAALAQHLQALGFDPATGQCQVALGEAALHGCGGGVGGGCGGAGGGGCGVLA